MTIIIEAIKYNEILETRDYLSYTRTNLVLIDVDLKDKLEKLLLHRKDIETIYKNNSDKNQLWKAIKEYLY